MSLWGAVAVIRTHCPNGYLPLKSVLVCGRLARIARRPTKTRPVRTERRGPRASMSYQATRDGTHGISLDRMDALDLHPSSFPKLLQDNLFFDMTKIE
uniref:SFRICE_018964 n=1 Tax=Spodoptera frugiperda TaxID=7108 RepID=A0A2H1W5N9_SPOFR